MRDGATENGIGSSMPLPSEGVLELLERNGVSLSLIDAEGRVLWASPALLAQRKGRVVGEKCHDALWRRQNDCLVCARESVLQSGITHRGWIPETRPGQGGPRRLMVQMRAAPGQMLEAVIDTHVAPDDLADQLFRERVLSEGLRHVPVGVLLLDASLRVVMTNPAAAQLLQRTEPELKGRRIGELLPASALPEEILSLQATGSCAQLALERESELELEQEGERRVLRVGIATIPDEERGIAAAVTTLTDITRGRLLTDALARKVAQLDLLRETGVVLGRMVALDQVLRAVLAAVVHPRGLGLSVGALFIVDELRREVRGRLARRAPREGTLLRRDDLSLALEELAFEPLGQEDRVLDGVVRAMAVPAIERRHPLLQALQRGKTEALPLPSEFDCVEPRLAPLLDGGEPILVPLYDQGKALGVIVAAPAVHEPILDRERLDLITFFAASAAGAIERARLHDELAVRLEDLRDVNLRLRNLQAQTLKAERLTALGELAAEIVHEIRNPLTVIGGFARRLERELDDGDARREGISIIVEETRRMEAIVDRIRNEVGRAKRPELSTVDPAELVRAAVARFAQLALEQRVTLRCQVEEDLPLVVGNRDILLEVLDNLLRNAFEAVAGEGMVTLRAQRLRDAVHLVVEDDGPGIGPERLEKIFEPYYTTKAQGTGLGLPLSKRLVDQCGGSLTADSRLGEGARFRIVLRTLAPKSRGLAADDAIEHRGD